MTDKILDIIGAKPRRLNWIASKLNISEDEAQNLIKRHKKELTVIGSGSTIRVRTKCHGMELPSYMRKTPLKGSKVRA
jgi:DNA-binding Lrp family transcriptional regulator